MASLRTEQGIPDPGCWCWLHIPLLSLSWGAPEQGSPLSQVSGHTRMVQPVSDEMFLIMSTSSLFQLVLDTNGCTCESFNMLPVLG